MVGVLFSIISVQGYELSYIWRDTHAFCLSRSGKNFSYHKSISFLYKPTINLIKS